MPASVKHDIWEIYTYSNFPYFPFSINELLYCRVKLNVKDPFWNETAKVHSLKLCVWMNDGWKAQNETNKLGNANQLDCLDF